MSGRINTVKDAMDRLIEVAVEVFQEHISAEANETTLFTDYSLSGIFTMHLNRIMEKIDGTHRKENQDVIDKYKAAIKILRKKIENNQNKQI